MNEQVQEPDSQVEAPEQPEAEQSKTDELRERIHELERQLHEARDGMLRAIADLQNYRKRAMQEANLARQSATVAIAEKILPALDNFERTLSAAEAGASKEAVIEGIKLVEKQLRVVLDQHDVRPIDAVGKPFDPNFHEAVVSEESEHPEGTVTHELERGYAIGSRVIRPTKAKVSKGRKD